MPHKQAEREVSNAIGNCFHYGTPAETRRWKPASSPSQGAHGIGRIGTEPRRGERARLRLAKQKFVADGRFLLANISLIGGLHFAEMANLEIPEELGSLRAWHARTFERPSVENAALGEYGAVAEGRRSAFRWLRTD